MILNKGNGGKQRARYPTDLTDKQWKIIEPFIPKAKPGGRRREIDIREITNAIFYILKAGCEWRMLPHDFPNWKTVYDYFRTWKREGTWKKIHDALRDKVRVKAKKKTGPTAGIIDSQSVKTGKKGEFVAMMLGKR